MAQQQNHTAMMAPEPAHRAFLPSAPPPPLPTPPTPLPHL